MNSFRTPMLTALAVAVSAATADTWQMRQRDAQNTGRAYFTIPSSRLNAGLLDIPAWQTPAPGSPSDGWLDCSSVLFADGAGPSNADVAIAGYHWPKGVQALDRHTGKRLWAGNPAGGELIGQLTAAFSNDAASIYVLNDATESDEFPAGHPLMAFPTREGPTVYRHNGANANPGELSLGSPRVSADGRVFLHAWDDRPYGATDDGLSLTRTFAADARLCECSNPVALDESAAVPRLVSGGRCGEVRSFSLASGSTIWAAHVDHIVEAAATIDPLNGRVFIPAGDSDITIVGLRRDGANLWTTTERLLYTHVAGVNSAQRAQSGGCLSHDGATFYFQTLSQEGDGRLFAVRTSNGSLKWSLNTGSRGWEREASSPIVTPDGVLFMGTNEGGRYIAVRDEGTAGVIIDSIELPDNAIAGAVPTLSEEGLLYLPLRATWIVGNGDGDQPSLSTENLFSAFDLNTGATLPLPPPSAQAAFIGNHSVRVMWTPLPSAFGGFHHYAVYRSTEPFTSVLGMSPIGGVSNRDTGSYVDSTAANGVRYYYAVTSVGAAGGEMSGVVSVGPRTPRDETDLQVASIARSPQYPRYAPTYTDYLVTEPNGFGPYYFSAATGLGNGQTAATKHMPDAGEPITYTATVRNRGTNAFAGTLAGTWRINGAVHSSVAAAVTLQPGETHSFSIVRPWTQMGVEISFGISGADARPSNNSLTVASNAVEYLSFVDATYIENFRENSGTLFPQARTDDLIDWANRHCDRMNELFADSGSPKRISYGVLQVLDDHDPDPGTDSLAYAIFPFRFRASDGDIRYSGYYQPDDDIDYGLLHEEGHQLGLVDVYQWDLSPDRNYVSSLGYSSPRCLMHGCSPVFSPQSSLAMTHWQNVAHGYFGQYLYGIPATCRMRFLAGDGVSPLAGAQVSAYQMCVRPDLGPVITDQVKFQGMTDSQGYFNLPNVDIDESLVPPAFCGDTLHDNPFGYVAVVGHNALMHFKVEDRGFVDYSWLDLAEVNTAYYSGSTAQATFTRRTTLGGDIQMFPPPDMAESNAASWATWAQDGTITLSDDPVNTVYGGASVKGVFTGGFDNYLRYPGDRLAQWNLSNVSELRVFCYTENQNTFQSASPWVRLGNNAGYFEFRTDGDILNESLGRWVEFVIPLSGDELWHRTQFGSPDFGGINYLEFHADTWGYGFNLWIDGVRFVPDPCPADFNQDGGVDGSDIEAFFTAWENGDSVADLNSDGGVDGADVETFFTYWEQGGCIG